MTTIRFTRVMGELFVALKVRNCGIAILRGWSRLMLPEQFASESIGHELAKTFKKNGWIEPHAYDPDTPYSQQHWWHRWYGRNVWVLSDIGKSIAIPPEETWLEQ